MWEVIIAGAAAVKVPGLFDAAVKATGERLLGPVMDSWAQPIKDRTERRSRIASAITDLAVKDIDANASLYKAEVDALLQQAGMRTERVSTTFGQALSHIADVEPETAGAAPEPPSEDWLNRWSRYVEDASSEDLQDAFARILAGEITRKGSFSVATLRLVSELSQDVASEFQTFWSNVIEDYAIAYPEYNRGEGWQRLLALREVGLVSAANAAIHRPQPLGPLWGFGIDTQLLVEVDPAIHSEIPIINLTRLGRELGSILPPPPQEANLRRFALESPNKIGWKRASIVHPQPDGTAGLEVLWTAPNS